MKTFNLKIDGMYCSMCETHVNDVIRNNFKVKKVKSNHKDGTAQIMTEEILNKNDLNKVLKDYGYKVYKIEEGEFEKKKGFFSFFKK